MGPKASEAMTADFVSRVLSGGRGQNLSQTVDMALYGVWGLSRAIQERLNGDRSGPGRDEDFGTDVWELIYYSRPDSAERRMWDRLELSEASAQMEDDQRYLSHPIGWAFDKESIGFDKMRTVLAAASDHIGFDEELSDEDIRSHCVSFFEGLLEAVSDLDEAAAAEQSTGHGVAHLLAGLASRSGTVGVVDIACGYGSAIAESILAGVHTVRGSDVDKRLLAIAEMRAEVHGTVGVFEVRSAFDEPEQSHPDGTGIMLDPPLETPIVIDGEIGRPAMSDDSRWLQSAWAATPAGGRAVVVLSRESLELRRSGNEVLAGLICGGWVKGLIVLPASVRSNGSAPTVVWVLERTFQDVVASGVLVVDARVVIGEDQGADENMSVASSRMITEAMASWVEREVFVLPVRAAHIVRVADLSEVTQSIPLPRQLDYDGRRGLAYPTEGRLLTHVALENFKSFATGQAVLRPLTLIFGPNSAGKSSLIQSLLLVKESLREGRVTTRSEQADLGSFDALVHSHDTTREVGLAVRFMPSAEAPIRVFSPSPLASRQFSICFESPVPGRISWTDVRVGTDRNWVNFVGSASPRKQPTVNSSNITNFFETDKPSEGVLADVVEAFVPGAAKRAEARKQLPQPFEQERWEALRQQVQDSPVLDGHTPINAEFRGLRPTGMWNTKRADGVIEGALVEPIGVMLGMAAAVSDELELIFQRLAYLGPVRPAPQRFYSLGPAADDDFADQLRTLSEQPHALSRVNEWLTRLGLRYQIGIERFVNSGGASTDVLGLSLLDPRSGIQLSTTDVGYGISQVVPLIMSLTTSRNTVICVEQPEIHLHPGLQAELGDLLIDSVRELGRGNQVIAETHSEHLMLRIQRRIREGVIDPEDVSVLYVDQNTAGESRVQRLRLDSAGAFVDEWPSGFFEERYEEVFGVDL